jgi:hypothetical protein
VFLFNNKLTQESFEILSDIVVHEFFSGGYKADSEFPFFMKIADPKSISQFEISPEGAWFKLPYSGNPLITQTSLIPMNIVGVTIQSADLNQTRIRFTFEFTPTGSSSITVNSREEQIINAFAVSNNVTYAEVISTALNSLTNIKNT